MTKPTTRLVRAISALGLLALVSCGGRPPRRGARGGTPPPPPPRGVRPAPPLRVVGQIALRGPSQPAAVLPRRRSDVQRKRCASRDDIGWRIRNGARPQHGAELCFRNTKLMQ